jgi:hypothetical protein
MTLAFPELLLGSNLNILERRFLREPDTITGSQDEQLEEKRGGSTSRGLTGSIC